MMTTSRSTLLLATALVAGLTSAAHAELAPTAAPAAPVARDAPDDQVWYGGRTLLADGLAIGLFVTGAALGERGQAEVGEVVSAAGALGLLFAAPGVHAFRGNAGRAVTSFGLRYASITLGFAIGAELAEGCDGFLCEIGGGFGGSLVGLGLAVVVDSALLARDTRSAPARTWMPSVSAGPAGAQVGIGGTF